MKQWKTWDSAQEITAIFESALDKIKPALTTDCCLSQEADSAWNSSDGLFCTLLLIDLTFHKPSKRHFPQFHLSVYASDCLSHLYVLHN